MSLAWPNRTTVADANLEGGTTLWALHAMTGDMVFGLSRCVGPRRRLEACSRPDATQPERRWQRLNIKHRPTADEPRKAILVPTDEAYDEDSLWGLLLEYHENEVHTAALIRGVACDDSSPVS